MRRTRTLPLFALTLLCSLVGWSAQAAVTTGALASTNAGLHPPVITDRGAAKAGPLLTMDSPARDDLDPAHDEFAEPIREDLTFAPPLTDVGAFEADGMETDEGGGSEGGSGGSQMYTVKKGDTLGSISRKFFGSTKYWKKIASANGIGDPRSLKVGRVIRIPTVSGASRRSSSGSRGGGMALPPVQTPGSLPSVNLPPVISQSGPANETVLYQDGGLPRVILPGTEAKKDDSRNFVTINGMTGLINTVAAYTMGDGMFSTAFGVVWNKITRRSGTRLKSGEDGDFYQFPIALTYAAPSFEAGLVIPFESYDIFAPITYNFRDNNNSGMGDAALRLKFSTENENMASALGVGAIFATSDRKIGIDESDNAWEVFGALSTKRKTGGNFHVNGGYQAGSGNTSHEGVFFNVGFEYSANSQFNFMGEVNSYNRVNQGRSTDLTLGMRYYPRPGMAFSVAAPIALSNDMFFGYDYRLIGQLQYRY